MNMVYNYEYSNGCPCGERFTGNCAHYLCNWLIKNGKIAKHPAGCSYYCDEGRPVRANDVKNVIYPSMGLRKLDYEPDGNCFIFCRNKQGERHVYYGTKDYAEAGTLSGEDMEAIEYEFYA